MDDRPKWQQMGWRKPGPKRARGRKGRRRPVPHRVRRSIASKYPIHIWTRLLPSERGGPGLQVLRTKAHHALLRRAFADGCVKEGFRLVHYAILNNHLHFIAEAKDRNLLARGMQGLLIRIAKRLNKMWSRRGKVFEQRYGNRVLKTPREVRNALCYVLHNARRHGLAIRGIDLCTSGAWFDGWREHRAEQVAVGETSCVVRAKTWLLTKGWRRHKLLSIDERPHGAPP